MARLGDDEVRAKVLDDLQDRLASVVGRLRERKRDLERSGWGAESEKYRIRGKIEGVSLAMSYVGECLRDLAELEDTGGQFPKGTDNG